MTGRWLALLLFDATLIGLLFPDFSELTATLRHPRAAVAERGADTALATLTGATVWAIAAWLALGLLATAAAALPGAIGRLAATASRALLPRFLRATLAGSAGLGVLLTPAAALASGPPVVGPAPATAPSWPVDPTPPSPPPTWPTDPSTTQHAHHRLDSVITVRPGDSLWSIVAGELGRDARPSRIAAGWPRWFAANRRVIGADPGLIRPGQVLHAPADQQNPESHP